MTHHDLHSFAHDRNLGSLRMGPMMIDSGYRDITGRIKLLLAESPIAEVRRIRVEQDGERVVL